MANRPSHAQVVDDTTKVIYSTNTTKLFSPNTLFENDRIFYKKDTFFTVSKPSLTPYFPYSHTLPHYKNLFPKDSLKPNKYLNDSTKNDTLKKTLNIQSRFYKNIYNYTRVDTAIEDIHNYNMIYYKRNIHQNLGILGTPSKPVFYRQPELLGYQHGYESYNLHTIEPHHVKYYNSKSPYTNLYYVNGPHEENKIHVEINRNITRNWNTGFYYRRMNSLTHIGPSSNDRNMMLANQNFVIYTSLKSRNERYHLMANFIYFVHKQHEYGGLKTVNVDETLSQDSPPRQLNSWPIYLGSNRFNIFPFDTRGQLYSRDRRMSYYLYHQYDILKGGKLSVFHEIERKNQKFNYTDPFLYRNNIKNYKDSTSQPNDPRIYFYDQVRSFTLQTDGSYVADTTQFLSEFTSFSNKFGINGIQNQYSWALFYKIRRVNNGGVLAPISPTDIIGNPITSLNRFAAYDTLSQISINEQYIGGMIKYRISDSLLLKISTQAILFTNTQSKNDTLLKLYTPKGDHHVEAELNYKNKNILGYRRMLNSPNINYLYINHNNFYWTNEYSGTISNAFYTKNTFYAGNTKFEVNISLTILHNYIYFKERVVPMQERNMILISENDFLIYTHIGKIHFDILTKYSKIIAGPDVLRFPELWVNPRIYLRYAPKSKEGRQIFLAGFDINYRTSYKGDAYMPTISNYYLQNEFNLNNNILIDIFISAKIRNARVFTKINNFNNMIGLSTGYYITPNYPAINSSAVLGVQWLLFD
ncbi:MAG: putative porin [Cytophagales bacterium]|nr:putative porin [Cytophagales bacterium]